MISPWNWRSDENFLDNWPADAREALLRGPSEPDHSWMIESGIAHTLCGRQESPHEETNYEPPPVESS